MHVVQAPWVRLEFAHRFRLLAAVSGPPTVFTEFVGRIAVAVGSFRPGAAGILPLRLGGQSVNIPLG